ncbi:LysR family transcriptional regulator [Streptomyces sp. TRM66268-LWL]|uniref:LysR family transcriptional regulator n=1 Tax=Streptomyces polyasparticus TaxID=2767826 RepID=A0ABR7SUA4_9ACTN|nr:LysR family transcriptional regulator [Streptomyces polyasparticus]MBC9718983.1 LysR family transcriptional regulator [Streptomyces polyasparticus]
MLERHELEAFLTLAEELHFGRTAERLHLSTARVSQTIAKLERRIGVRLFDRTSRSVQLTSVGRDLAEAVGPAWDRITEAVARAVAAGRGLTGTLTVAFTGPAAGQLVVGIAQTFREQHPDCEVRIREAQFTDVAPWLRAGEADLALTRHPFDLPDLVEGPVLVSEARMLAVPAGHPFARQDSPSLPAESLARVTLLQHPETLPPSLRDDLSPPRTPAGTPIPLGPTAATLNELLTLVGAGTGTALTGAHTRRYFTRPDVAYVPLDGMPPVRWGLVWRAGAESERVRAFAQAASGLVD